MTIVQFGTRDAVVGYGLYLDSGEILTASHVLNAMSGVDPWEPGTRVGQIYSISFPLVGDGEKEYSAKVRRWLKPKRGDIATLEFVKRPEIGGAILDPLIDLKNGAVRVWGRGAWAEARVVAPTIGNRWQIDQDPNPNHVITSGFSGSPVLNSDGRVIGILWGGRANHRDSQMIPAQLLDERRFVHDAHQGAPNWHLSYVVEELLTDVFNDLVSLESRGLQPHECAVLTTAFGQLNNVLSEIEGTDGWVEPPHIIAERMEETYREWNDWIFGGEGAGKRRASLSKLRKVRGELNVGARRYKTRLFQDRLVSVAGRIVQNFEPVMAIRDEAGRTRFPRLSRAIGEYKKRARGNSPFSKQPARR